MIRNFLFALLLLFLILLQTVIFPSSPSFPAVNLVLLPVVGMSTHEPMLKLLLWTLFLGGTANLFSGFPFGTIPAILGVLAILLHHLFQNLFTNRSLYSLIILTMVGTAVHDLLLILSSFFLKKINLIPFALVTIEASFWKTEITHVLTNSLAVFILFFIGRSLTRMFQQRFLMTARRE